MPRLGAARPLKVAPVRAETSTGGGPPSPELRRTPEDRGNVGGEMNVAIVALIVLVGWGALSLIAALVVGAMAGARDHVLTTPLHVAMSRAEDPVAV